MTSGGTHVVTQLEPLGTLLLDDGTRVRLAGLHLPTSPSFITTGQSWKPERDALAALSDLTMGKRVEIAYATRSVDRWGSLVAHVFSMDRGQREWVQGALLRRGHARVDALPGEVSCMQELLAHEREAMRDLHGLWAHPAYRIRWADTPQRLMRLRNTFQLIEGTVRKVALTRSRIYLNFGSDWRSDFTAAAALNTRAFTAETLTRLQALEGKRVRVRGWIERRNGPYIELFDAMQVEERPDDNAPATARGTAPPSASAPADADPNLSTPDHSGAIDL